jgi:hypothetical protein
MRRIFTFSLLTIVLVTVLSACARNSEYIDESYWLTKERGEVVLSDPYCQYYVVETDYGYTILRSLSNYKPYEGSVVYGNFSNYGLRDFYNRSNGQVFTAEVKEYWLSYFEAQDAIDYYCY